MIESYPKQAYQEKMRAYLDVLRTELDRLHIQLYRESYEIKVENPQAAIREASDVDDRAHSHLKEIEACNAVKWEELRSNIEEAYHDLMNMLDFLIERVETTEISG